WWSALVMMISALLMLDLLDGSMALLLNQDRVCDQDISQDQRTYPLIRYWMAFNIRTRKNWNVCLKVRSIAQSKIYLPAVRGFLQPSLHWLPMNSEMTM